MLFTPRQCVKAILTLGLLWILYNHMTLRQSHNPFPTSSRQRLNELATRREALTTAFDHAWTGYSTHCFGHDAIHPVSNTCSDELGGWGASAIDALSTAILLEKRDAVRRILRFVATLDFTAGGRVQVFEVMIRHLAGLVSANDLLSGAYGQLVPEMELRSALLEQMVRLGDILTCAFDVTSGLPRNSLDPKTCTTYDAETNTVAAVGTTVLEFARLSAVTGNDTYIRLTRRAEAYLLEPKPAAREIWPGILGSSVAVADGSLLDVQGSWGSLVDSFYEYLLKAYLFDKKTYKPYLNRWKLAADSTMRHIASSAFGRPETVFLPYWNDKQLFNAQDSLSWFAGGNFILGGTATGNQTLLDFGLRMADTAAAVYAETVTGLGGEFIVWTTNCDDAWGEETCNANNSVRLSTPTFKLRPEAVETWYYAYRATGNRKYQDWVWGVFLAIEKFCKTETGFSAISDVNAADGGDKLDEQESFLFAELLKYLWLIQFDVNDGSVPVHPQLGVSGKQGRWLFNTEGHPLLIG